MVTHLFSNFVLTLHQRVLHTHVVEKSYRVDRFIFKIEEVYDSFREVDLQGGKCVVDSRKTRKTREKCDFCSFSTCSRLIWLGMTP